MGFTTGTIPFGDCRRICGHAEPRSRDTNPRPGRAGDAVPGGPPLEVARIPEPRTGRATSRVAPTVGRIVGAFKSLCVNKWAKGRAQKDSRLKEAFWQRNYYEHIIRNEDELYLVREYISLNPVRWAFDRDNPDHADNREYERKWGWLEA